MDLTYLSADLFAQVQIFLPRQTSSNTRTHCAKNHPQSMIEHTQIFDNPVGFLKFNYRLKKEEQKVTLFSLYSYRCPRPLLWRITYRGLKRYTS